jgi:hypothetical protein
VHALVAAVGVAVGAAVVGEEVAGWLADGDPDAVVPQALSAAAGSSRSEKRARARTGGRGEESIEAILL